MKTRIYTTILLLVLALNLYSQSTTKWGLVGDENETLIDETEISVAEWLEYCYYNNSTMEAYYINNKLTKEQEKFLDSLTITKWALPPNFESLGVNFFNPSNRKLIKVTGLRGYISLPISQDLLKDTLKNRLDYYLDCPITNVSYEQVEFFCKWRTKVDSIVAKYYGKKYYFEYKLPSISWSEKLVPTLDSIHEKKGATYNYRNAHLVIKRHTIDHFYIQNCGVSLMPIFTFNDYKIYNGCKIYNLRGNAAEMTSEKGLAYGGSYYHWADKSNSNVILYYSSPQSWLGFRCIAVKKSW